MLPDYSLLLNFGNLAGTDGFLRELFGDIFLLEDLLRLTIKLLETPIISIKSFIQVLNKFTDA